jgi:hypothetical protein
MIRPVAAVVLSLIAMATFVFAASIALWFVVGLDRVLTQGSFDGTPLLNVWSVAVSMVGALAAGWLCFRIAGSRTAVIVLACLCLVMGMGNALGQRSKPAPGPRPPGLAVMEAVKLRKEPAGSHGLFRWSAHWERLSEEGCFLVAEAAAIYEGG